MKTSYAILLFLLAGCTLSPSSSSTLFEAVGEGGRFSFSWAWDGVGVVPLEGKAHIRVDSSTNVGFVLANVTVGSSNFSIEWTNFSEEPGKTYQSGGVAKDLVEHGDTGVGDSNVPKVLASSAGWGEAKIERGGKLFADPSGKGTWKAHYMYVPSGIRFPDGKIYNSDRSAPYDPKNPSSGSTPATPQLWLVFKPHNTSTPYSSKFEDSFGPSTSYSKTFPLPLHLPLHTLNVTVESRGAPLGQAPPLGNVDVNLLDPTGKSLGHATVGGPSGESKMTFSLEHLLAGDYSLKADGSGALSYSIVVSGTYDPMLVLLFEFDSVQVLKGP